MATGGDSLRLNCKKMNIVLKHFAKQLINKHLSLSRERYTYRTGPTDEDCQLYVGNIVLLREKFVSRMK